MGVLAGGTRAVLLLTVPAGIILCGTAAAFAKVVDARRYDIMEKIMGLSAKRK
jgi:hypothetical protein